MLVAVGPLEQQSRPVVEVDPLDGVACSEFIAIDSGDGPVYPSVESASTGRYQPLSRPLYLYVNTRSLREKPDIAAFLDSYFSGASRWLHLTGYLPLDEATYAANRQRLERR